MPSPVVHWSIAEQVLAEFRSGACPLMVATDVAARGLDVKDIGVVINYTFPL